MFVTIPSSASFMARAESAVMKIYVWEPEFVDSLPAEVPHRRKRKSVTEILRAAYRKHFRDAHTRRAVKRWLR